RLGADPVSMEIWAATRDPAAADHPFPAPYSVQTLRDELQKRPVVLLDGGLEEVEALSGAAEREVPDPARRVEGLFALHSEQATRPPAVGRGRRSRCFSRAAGHGGVLGRSVICREGATDTSHVPR